MPNENALTERDEHGLSLQERRVLTEIASTGSWQEAAKNLGITRRQMQTLFARPSFKQQYDELFNTEEIENAKRELNMAISGLGKIYEEALQAETVKRVTVECPKCKHSFNVFVEVVSWMARLKAGETLMKFARLLRDERSIKVEGQVGIIHMSAGEYMALQRLRMGLPVPDHIYRRLMDLGQQSNFTIPPNPEGLEYIEGEVIHASDTASEQ